MSKRKKLYINFSLVALAVVPVILWAYDYGPDQGYTAAPGDNAKGCIASGCHTGTPNAGGGSVKIVASGGTSYIPGQVQQIQVTITDSTKKKYGFELTARVDSNAKLQGAGLLTATDANTQVVNCSTGNGYSPFPGSCPSGNSLQWVEHTSTGVFSSKNVAPSFTYTFNWTPPSTDVGTVTLYAAGNAVNFDGTENGDNIYTTKLQLTPAAAGGVPTIGGVVSDATFVAGGAVATSSWVAIFGTDLAPPGDVRPLNSSTEIVNNKLPTSMDGTSITVNNKPAFLGFISPGQVNIETPDDTATGPVPVVVTTTGGVSNTFTLNLAKFSPGLFPSGFGNYIAAQKVTQDGNVVAIGTFAGSLPAKPGETIVLWGTGFGPTNGTTPWPAGQVVPSSPAAPGNLSGITVTIGGQPAAIAYAAVTISGLAQINVTVPASLSNGDQTVVCSVGGVQTQANAVIAVQN